MAKKHQKHKKWLYSGVFLVLFVAAAAMVYLVWDSYFAEKGDDTGLRDDGGSAETVTDGGGTDETGSEADEVKDVVEKPKVEQYDGEDPNMSESLSGAVTYAGVVDERLMIRMNIDQYLEEGRCELSLVKDGATIYNSVANVVSNVTTATCEGFDIPMGELEESGLIEIKINITAGNKTGVVWGEVGI